MRQKVDKTMETNIKFRLRKEIDHKAKQKKMKIEINLQCS